MKLFEPISVSGMELKNRVVFPPMVSRRGDYGSFVTEDCKNFYLQIAKGGVGFLILEAVYTYGPYPTILCIHDDEHIAGYKEMNDEIHSQTDTKVGVQINHAMPYVADVEELTLGQIEQFYDLYVAAAVRCKKAGFDSVEIHAAHCYMVANFLSLKNKRKDEYGRTLEGRMKLVLTLFSRMREALGKDYPIGIRMNADDFVVGGNTLEQSRKIAQKLVELDIAYLSLSAGGRNEDGTRHGSTGFNWPYSDIGPYRGPLGYSGHRAMPPAYMPEGVNVDLHADIKKAIQPSKIPVITAGKISTPEFAESILQEGKADLIGVCRGILCDPEWPNKAKEGRSNDIIRCVYCCLCMNDLRVGRPVSCQQWKKKKGEK
jgi:dimethylglycine catabolism A